MIGGFGPGYGVMGWEWLAMVLGFLSMLVFIAAVILGMVWLVRALAGTARPGMERETPLEILRRRMAAGEISYEEYERMKDMLER
ncbi:MAG: SHOCT domain-containing protein [Chloroflexi bacterium]|nr:SHOCT domain-containing protein [Chloroflexota bacterium]